MSEKKIWAPPPCILCGTPLSEASPKSAKRQEAEKASKTLRGGADDTANDRERLALLNLAHSVARDDRHWSVVDVADRAENANELAEAVIAFFGIKAPPCPKSCKDCDDHRKNTGGDEKA